MEKPSDTIPLSTTMLLTLSVFSALVTNEANRVRPADLLRAVPSVTVVRPVADGARTAATTFVVANAGNRARYQVQEQLVGVNLPNLAIGETGSVTGAIAFDSTGHLVGAASRIVVDVSGLRSDKERRDGYVRSRILDTEQYPTVTFTPTSVQGFTGPLPASGTKRFTLLGDLTIHGVTKPATWQVEARFDGDRLTGSANTRFTFADFGLTQPRVPIVLSVDDTIHLYYDFALVREEPQS